MRVGDTAEVLIPYSMAYGMSGSGSIPPYSNLRFNVRLVDIVNYETRP
ncbi:MAG: FKBP-type peptidyl-prolyl cis-trans isomerase [Muribaculaceae bacterium]|nr:FKBP-type peptidyl-prolyl cis-trans isomerase [Muribaculaceae bacterium]